MSSLRRTARRALAPLALMALIFWLSAQPDLESGLGVLDLLLRKLAHAFVFGSLALLWWWTLRPVSRKPIAIAVAISLLYAISDEYHQSFIEGRAGTVLDVCIDLAGIGAAALMLRYDHHVRRVLKGDGESPDRGVPMPGNRRPAVGARRRPGSAGRPLRDRGDRFGKERPPAAD